jgi:serine/threonine protein kinase
VLVMELVSGGDLWCAMRADVERPEGRRFGWYNRGRQVALQVASGLLYLHQQNVVHMDLKPQ